MGMIRTVVTLGLFGLSGVGGWLAGSFYPAPDGLKHLVGEQAQSLARIDPRALNWEALTNALPEARMAQLRGAATTAAALAGEVIIVERSAPEQFLEGLETVPAPPPPLPPVPELTSRASPAQGILQLCPRMSVSNAPKQAPPAQQVLVQGVALLVDPTLDACLSSGFGLRNGQLHKGLDYHNPEGGPILAAADGVIIEKKYRDDYGNMLLIDHGGGVYTRYAHLASFMEGAAMGAQVKSGQEIGLMGNTAAYRIPVHLHFELLIGDYANPKASFGLEPKDPFGFPKAG